MDNKSTFLAVFSAGLLMSTSAFAGWQDGVNAYEQGRYQRALEEFIPLVSSPDAEHILYYMGRMYQKGQGVQKNLNAALNYYYKAAQAGDTRAAVELGSIYFTGQDFAPDYALAKQWFEFAYKGGNPVAAYNLGVIHYNGVGGELYDYQTAYNYYKFAADRGYDQAQKEVGVMLYEGSGTPQDYNTALDYLIKAANQGNIEAMLKLGEFLSNDSIKGAPINFIHAHKWYNIAAGYGPINIRQSAGEARDALTKKMKPEEISAAQDLARKWKPKPTPVIIGDIKKGSGKKADQNKAGTKTQEEAGFLDKIFGLKDDTSDKGKSSSSTGTNTDSNAKASPAPSTGNPAAGNDAAKTAPAKSTSVLPEF